MSNPQRKGQWLFNKLREDIDVDNDLEKEIVARRLWNMPNAEFDKIMSEY